MAKPIFVARDSETIRVITFEIPGGVTTPAEFSEAVEENKASFVAGEKGLIVDGRGPVWAFAMIVHEGHPSAFIATRDPRLGAVVVETHTPGVKRGDVVPFPEGLG